MFHPYQQAGPTRIPPSCMVTRVRKEVDTRDVVNARHVESWRASLPIVQEPAAWQGGVDVTEGAGTSGAPRPPEQFVQDMLPLSSRTDKRDFRQSQPFVADGPPLATNPQFDRQDPTRDPRNMIREMRSAVQEEKESTRGIEESKKILERNFATRWTPEDEEPPVTLNPLDAQDSMRPKMNSMETNWRKLDDVSFSKTLTRS